jgi:hypothetical protein
MNHGRVLFHLVKADFLVRARRSSFLWTLGLAIFLGYETFAGNILLNLGDYRGIFNSAWVGALMAIVASVFLSLAGFYIVKGAIEQDQTSRVGQVLATTPMTRVFYTAGKTISNFAVLAAMVLVMMASAVLMQFFRGEDHSLDLWALLGPLVLYTLPAMAFVAALAVLFETLPVLRGGAGNVIWFFLWTALIAVGIGAALSQDQAIGASLYLRDFSGLPSIMFQMRAALLQIDPHAGGTFSLTIGGHAPAQRFLWQGLHWDAVQLAARLVWIGLASAAALLAALFFHRFDPAREPLKRARRQAAESFPPESAPGTVANALVAGAWRVRLTPVGQAASGQRFVRLAAAELRLMMKGQRWWWYAVAAGLFFASLAAPLEISRGALLVAAWLWPILLWSRMGSREARAATESLVFSCPRTLWQQLPAAWLAGVVVALVTGGGVGIRLLLAADAPSLAAWTAGALFIPTLAMALGLVSRTSKLFEAIYTVWWYIGAFNHTPGLDYMGTTRASSRPVSFLLLTGVLLLVCHLARRFPPASIRSLLDRRLLLRG